MAKPASSVASKLVPGYNTSSRPARPFEADYPNGAPSDAAGNLTHTIDGTPITGKYVVGRAQVGGGDVALPSGAYDEIAEAATGSPILVVPQSQLGRDVGRVVTNRFTKKPLVAQVSASLKGDRFERVAAHEIGHVIDQFVGEIPTKGVASELADIDNPSDRFHAEYRRHQFRTTA